MSARNNVFNYGWVAKWFHWIIGLAIIGMLAFGLYIDDLPNGPDKLQYIGLHKATGITILGLVVLRFLWRQTNINPALPGDMGTFTRLLAHLSHYALYFMMFYMPIVGWLMSSAAGYPVSVFGYYTLPNLIAADKEQAKLFAMMHTYGGFAFIGLISLHVLAGLYHLVIRRDRVFVRMMPWGRGA